MGLFNKKPRESYNDDDFNNDFYRGPEDEDSVISDEEDNDLVPPMPATPKKSTAASTGAWKVLKPHNARDGLIIADYLMNGCTVVMNIEEIDRETTVHLIDFLMGAVHVLDGELRQVSTSTFVISPRKGEITEDAESSRKADSDTYR